MQIKKVMGFKEGNIIALIGGSTKSKAKTTYLLKFEHYNKSYGYRNWHVIFIEL